MNCQQPYTLKSGCSGLDLTLNFGNDPTNLGNGVTVMSDLNFDTVVYQDGVTVRINNFNSNEIGIINIHCRIMLSCTGLKVIVGFGIELWDMNVYCDVPHSCDGCTINGQSCAMISMMNNGN